MTMTIRTYREASKYQTYKERFEYLKLSGHVAEDTFGSKRYLNQDFYKSKEWKQLRNKIIMRDSGCDLGIEGLDINGRIYIHHIEPLTPAMFQNMDEFISRYNSMDNLICCSAETHNALHYSKTIPPSRDEWKPRKPNDTCPWK